MRVHSTFQFPQKGVFFYVPSWLEKEKQPCWLGKSEYLFVKCLYKKKYYFAIAHSCNVVLS